MQVSSAGHHAGKWLLDIRIMNRSHLERNHDEIWKSCPFWKKQLELKMLRMKKSLNRSNYVGHINSSAFRHFIQMLQSTLENINCLKKTSQVFFHNWKINHYKQHLGIINILLCSWINKIRKKSDQNPKHFQICFFKLKACLQRWGGREEEMYIYLYCI